MNTIKEIDTSNDIDTQLCVKQEPEDGFLDNFTIEPLPFELADDWSSQRIKNEVQNEAEIIKTPSKHRRKVRSANHPYTEKVHGQGKSNRTQLPCIVNIKLPAVLEQTGQKNHDETCDTSDEMPNTSSQSTISEKTCESYDITLNEIAGAVGQNSSNNTFTSKVCEILMDIQSTLKDLKAEIAENAKKIDKLQVILPQPWVCKSVKNDFNFPVSTEEQLLELEKQLEDKETAGKLFTHLTSRNYLSWREMILVCLKYMLSRNVAMLYNLNGLKGSKKKFRDLNMCNILVASVLHKHSEAATPDILKRISLILAGSRDWEGSRRKDKLKNA